jgi:hypothetical protein
VRGAAGTPGGFDGVRRRSRAGLATGAGSIIAAVASGCSSLIAETIHT